jgi:hypothetical protein
MEEFDNSWLEEYEQMEKDYEIFYKETVENIKCFYVYISKTNEIKNLHQEDVILSNGILKKDQLLILIKNNKNKNGTSHRLKHLLKYNIFLEPDRVEDFLYNKLNEQYLKPMTFLEDLYFEKTINALQDLNSLYFIFCERQTRDANKIQTKKKITFIGHRKSRRKTT